jgi:D-alanine-D-alanine ligase
MHIALLHNRDHDLLDDDPGREARQDVVRVAAALAAALEGGKRSVELVPVDQDLFTLHEAFAVRRPDVVINLCESLAADSRGEMVVPAMLDLLNVPYTGSSALSLALALHKNKAKEILHARGVPTPGFCVVERVEDLVRVNLPFPLIVKPAREDASMGIDFDSVVHDQAALGRAVSKVLRTFRQPALVERFIAGREIYVPLLGNAARRALPLTEIAFGKAFDHQPNILSYLAKWDETSPECIDSPSMQAVLDPALEARCIEVAMAAFDALECRDYGRVDLRVDVAGNPFVIDINPNCDLHPQAGFAKAAATAGIAYADLALHLVELAEERRHGNQAPRALGPTAARRAAGPHRDLHAGRGGLRARTHRRGGSAEQP